MENINFEMQIDELLEELDRIAREFSYYEYGLPVDDEDELPLMREAVSNWLIKHQQANLKDIRLEDK